MTRRGSVGAVANREKVKLLTEDNIKQAEELAELRTQLDTRLEKIEQLEEEHKRRLSHHQTERMETLRLAEQMRMEVIQARDEARAQVRSAKHEARHKFKEYKKRCHTVLTDALRQRDDLTKEMEDLRRKQANDGASASTIKTISHRLDELSVALVEKTKELDDARDELKRAKEQTNELKQRLKAASKLLSEETVKRDRFVAERANEEAQHVKELTLAAARSVEEAQRRAEAIIAAAQSERKAMLSSARNEREAIMAAAQSKGQLRAAEEHAKEVARFGVETEQLNIARRELDEERAKMAAQREAERAQTVRLEEELARLKPLSAELQRLKGDWGQLETESKRCQQLLSKSALRNEKLTLENSQLNQVITLGITRLGRDVDGLLGQLENSRRDNEAKDDTVNVLQTQIERYWDQIDVVKHKLTKISMEYSHPRSTASLPIPVPAPIPRVNIHGRSRSDPRSAAVLTSAPRLPRMDRIMYAERRSELEKLSRTLAQPESLPDSRPGRDANHRNDAVVDPAVAASQMIAETERLLAT